VDAQLISRITSKKVPDGPELRLVDADLPVVVLNIEEVRGAQDREPAQSARETRPPAERPREFNAARDEPLQYPHTFILPEPAKMELRAAATRRVREATRVTMSGLWSRLHGNVAAPPPVSSTAPRRILVFPSWFENNPYLNTMYLIARSRGYDLLLSTRLAPFYDHLASARRGDVIHIHWTAPIAQHAPDEADARARVGRFHRELRAARRRGLRVIWTVHNRVPHDCKYPEVERILLRLLAAEADLITVINPATAELLSDLVELDPSRLVPLPHPSYLGLYADSIHPAAARAAVGLEPHQRGVLFFGQMRRYKGLDEFFSAMRLVHQRRPETVMLVVGKTSDADLSWVTEALPPDVPSIVDHSFIPDDDVELWFRAADAVALPFQQVLNSGSMFLAASFGRSVVAPRQRSLEAEFGDETWVHFYDPTESPAALAASILAALDSPDDSDAALAFSRRRTPYQFSMAFDAALQTLE
jgi:beta-1,4-mannosyltransferase